MRPRPRAPLAHALGFRSGRTPCKATLSNLLRRLDVAAFERAWLRGLQERCPDLGDPLALDGKTLRGTAGYEAPGGCRASVGRKPRPLGHRKSPVGGA